MLFISHLTSLSQTQGHEIFFPMFSSRWLFYVYIQAYDPFLVSLCKLWGIHGGSLFSFAYGYSIHFLLSAIYLLSIQLSLYLYKKISWLHLCGFISGLFALFHWSMCLCFSWYCHDYWSYSRSEFDLFNFLLSELCYYPRYFCFSI